MYTSGVMTAIGRIMAPALVAFLAIGCESGPRFDYEGTWVGRRQVQEQAGVDNDVLRSIARIEVRIDRSGRFALMESGLAKEGNFVRTGEGAALDVDRLMGQPLDRQPEEVRKDIPRFELWPLPDGSLRFLDPRRPIEEVRLTRELKPTD